MKSEKSKFFVILKHKAVTFTLPDLWTFVDEDDVLFGRVADVEDHDAHDVEVDYFVVYN